MSLRLRYDIASCFFNYISISSQAELAVHVRKVEDVRRWLTEAFDGGPSGKLKKYRVCVLFTFNHFTHLRYKK